MKLEQFEETEKANQIPEGKGTMTVIRHGVKYIYLMDPVTKQVTERCFGPVFPSREGLPHGMGAVRD